jgi:hypothetical protein
MRLLTASKDSTAVLHDVRLAHYPYSSLPSAALCMSMTDVAWTHDVVDRETAQAGDVLPPEPKGSCGACSAFCRPAWGVASFVIVSSTVCRRALQRRCMYRVTTARQRTCPSACGRWIRRCRCSSTSPRTTSSSARRRQCCASTTHR